MLTFLPCRKNGLIKNVKLISKFLTSQRVEQAITIHTLLNISRSKSNQTMKFAQLIEYNDKYFSTKVMQKMRQGD